MVFTFEIGSHRYFICSEAAKIAREIMVDRKPISGLHQILSGACGRAALD